MSRSSVTNVPYSKIPFRTPLNSQKYCNLNEPEVREIYDNKLSPALEYLIVGNRTFYLFSLATVNLR